MSEVPPTTISEDRRSRRRYPIRLSLQFTATKIRSVTIAGTGSVLDLSSRGIAFTTEKTLHPHMRITLFISWPVLLEGETRIMLVANGTIVRTMGQVAAVKVSRYEFRTQKSD